jgi:hypothetical protein
MSIALKKPVERRLLRDCRRRAGSEVELEDSERAL